MNHHHARAHRRGEGGEHLTHHLDVAGLADLDPEREMFRGRQGAHRLDRIAERHVAAQISLDRHLAGAAVTVNGRRPVGDREIRHHRERRRSPAALRDAQILQQADMRARRLVDLDADRHQSVAGVELGEVGVDIGEGRDPYLLGRSLGRDAEVGGDLAFRKDATLGPFELGCRVLDDWDRPHLAGELVGGVVDDVDVGPGMMSEISRCPLSFMNQ